MNPKNENEVPAALREVWAWKETVCRETEGMGVSEALAHIQRVTDEAVKSFGFKTAEPPLAVAEAPCNYGTKSELLGI
jgi:hypothetical protein